MGIFCAERSFLLLTSILRALRWAYSCLGNNKRKDFYDRLGSSLVSGGLLFVLILGPVLLGLLWFQDDLVSAGLIPMIPEVLLKYLILPHFALIPVGLLARWYEKTIQ